ncbi:hypothetical protein [Streptomyces umbrinus]|uniref:hypothetical protein n=1 Tax=Streptomyces umbrinus TaxID=67370 RepID=UPI0033E42436
MADHTHGAVGQICRDCEHAAALPGAALSRSPLRDFFYQYGDSAGPTAGALENPEQGVCINTSEVEGKPGTAFSPRNQLPDADAMVYSEEDCQGVGTKHDPDAELGPEVTFKSVIFEVA